MDSWMVQETLQDVKPPLDYELYMMPSREWFKIMFQVLMSAHKVKLANPSYWNNGFIRLNHGNFHIYFI